MNLIEIYLDNKLKSWILILTVPTVILIFGSLILPELFWDSFLFRFLWGPVLADARDEPVNGISEGYNWVNTLAYGLVVALSLLGIYEIIDHYDIEVNKNFVLSLLPWLLLGGSLRALEDAGLFRESIAPLFISPIIYFVLGISAILTMVLGSWLNELGHTSRAFVLVPPLLIFLLLRLKFYTVLSVVMFAVLVVFYFVGIKYRWQNEKYLFSAYGGSFLAVALIYCTHYILTLQDSNPWEVPIILGYAFLATSLFVTTLYLLQRSDRISKGSLSILNLLIVFAHFFDASSTYRGIEYYGYVEKHVVPTLLIDLTGTSLVMYLLKLLIIVGSIYVLDVGLREELKDMRSVTVLVKFVIIVLGLAPGFRNMLRLAMGV
ncbi:MAG: DUF63 family protein [Candidatus Saliniplasma sp.]